MFLILSRFRPHVLNFLGAVHKGRPQSGGEEFVLCGQGGGGFSDADMAVGEQNSLECGKNLPEC